MLWDWSEGLIKTDAINRKPIYIILVKIIMSNGATGTYQHLIAESMDVIYLYDRIDPIHALFCTKQPSCSPTEFRDMLITICLIIVLMKDYILIHFTVSCHFYCIRNQNKDFHCTKSTFSYCQTCFLYCAKCISQ